MQAEQAFLDFDNFHLYDDQIMSAVDKRMTLLVSSCLLDDRCSPQDVGPVDRWLALSANELIIKSYSES